MKYCEYLLQTTHITTYITKYYLITIALSTPLIKILITDLINFPFSLIITSTLYFSRVGRCRVGFSRVVRWYYYIPALRSLTPLYRVLVDLGSTPPIHPIASLLIALAEPTSRPNPSSRRSRHRYGQWPLAPRPDKSHIVGTPQRELRLLLARRLQYPQGSHYRPYHDEDVWWIHRRSRFVIAEYIRQHLGQSRR